MKKPISRRQHGIVEYTFIPFVASAAKLAGFEDEDRAVRLTRIVSSMVTLSSLFTRAEWGPIPIIPFKFHLVIDTAIGGFSLSAPWLFDFSDNTRARNTFLAMGIVALMAGLFSQPEEMDESA
jgi:hypothetical protein